MPGSPHPDSPNLQPRAPEKHSFFLQNHVSSHAVIWPQNKEPPSLPLLIWCYHVAGNMDHKGSINVWLRAPSCLWLHYLLLKKRLWSCCPHPSHLSPYVKLDEILTFKLQHSLFLFCSVPEALKCIRLFQTVFWGKLNKTTRFSVGLSQQGNLLSLPRSTKGKFSDCWSPRLLFVHTSTQIQPSRYFSPTT